MKIILPFWEFWQLGEKRCLWTKENVLHNPSLSYTTRHSKNMRIETSDNSSEQIIIEDTILEDIIKMDLKELGCKLIYLAVVEVQWYAEITQ